MGQCAQRATEDKTNSNMIQLILILPEYFIKVIDYK